MIVCSRLIIHNANDDKVNSISMLSVRWFGRRLFTSKNKPKRPPLTAATRRNKTDNVRLDCHSTPIRRSQKAEGELDQNVDDCDSSSADIQL